MLFFLGSNVIKVGAFVGDCFSLEDADFAAGFQWNGKFSVGSVYGVAIPEQ